MNDDLKDIQTGFLYSDPSLLKGMGSVINIWGNYYTFNYSETPEKADRKAIENDWGMVAQDFVNACKKIIGII